MYICVRVRELCGSGYVLVLAVCVVCVRVVHVNASEGFMQVGEEEEEEMATYP